LILSLTLEDELPVGVEQGEEHVVPEPLASRTVKVEPLFDSVIGYDDVKRLFSMSIESDKPVHILLVGPPASAKT
jgi:Holliday junction DNA helicase RuvB